MHRKRDTKRSLADGITLRKLPIRFPRRSFVHNKVLCLRFKAQFHRNCKFGLLERKLFPIQFQYGSEDKVLSCVFRKKKIMMNENLSASLAFEADSSKNKAKAHSLEKLPCANLRCVCVQKKNRLMFVLA